MAKSTPSREIQVQPMLQKAKSAYSQSINEVQIVKKRNSRTFSEITIKQRKPPTTKKTSDGRKNVQMQVMN